MEDFSAELCREGDLEFYREAKGGVSGGCLFIHCIEDGESVKAHYGTEESEYTLSLGREETEQLFRHVCKESENRKEAFLREFGNADCTGRFYRTCEEAGIEYKLDFIW